MPLASRRLSNSSTASASDRRYSFPNTIDSSTKVTKEKVKNIMNRRKTRRRGARDKESNVETSLLQSPTPYWKVAKERGGKRTPPETRSTKKKKTTGGTKLTFSPDDKENLRANMVPQRAGLMSFSPPDQTENARREKEELETKEKDRARRVSKARDSGQLLVFSPTFRNPAKLPDEPHDSESMGDDTTEDYKIPASNDDGKTENSADAEEEEVSEDHTTPRNMEVDVRQISDNKSQLSFETHPSNGGHHSEQISNELKSLRETINRLVESKESSETTEQEKVLPNLEALTKTLTMTNSKLEEKNKRLETSMKEMESNLSAERERLVVGTASLEAELSAANRDTDSRISSLEEAKLDLEEKLTSLQRDKMALSDQVSELQSEIEEARGKVNETNILLQALKEEVGEEKGATEMERDSLAQTNEEISNAFEQLRASNEELKETIAQYEVKLDALENELLPESEDQLQKALDELQRYEDSDKETQMRIAEYEKAIDKLKVELENARQEKEEERAHFQALNEDSSQAYQQMTKELQDKNMLIEELQQQMESTEENIGVESKKVDQMANDMSNLQSKMDRRVEELEECLKDSLRQLEQSANEKKALEQKLAGALDQIRKDSLFKEQVLTKSNETSAAMHEMDDQRKLLQRRVNQLEERLTSTKTERDDARDRVETFNEREEELFNRLRESDRVRRSLHNRVMQLSGNIRVYVRVRPALPGEAEAAKKSAKPPQGPGGKKRKHVETEENASVFHYPGMGGSDDKKSTLGADDPTKNLLEVTEPKKDRGGLSERRKKWTFGFDHVFNPSNSQEDIWDATEPLVQSAIDGYNVTLFAYGQTGSGKTFTMLGEASNEGLISRAVRKLFEAKREIEELSRGENKVELSVELLEIYNEQVRDLLVPNSGPDGQELSLKVTANEVVGNVVLPLSNEVEVSKILDTAQKRRCVKATASNAVSSRGHMLFTIHFKVSSKNRMSRSGKLNVCDLAGSERLGKSKTNEHVGGALLRETKHINTSLSVLSNVIEKLQTGDANIPFRESKLTHLLQNSLGGNSKTLAIICCNPLLSHFHESLCSLRFAAKVNKVDLKAVANFSC